MGLPQERIAEVDRSRMVLIPAGEFILGVPDDDIFAEDHEKPQVRVNLSRFYIDVFPITNAQFGLFIKDGGYRRPEFWDPAGLEWKEQAGIEHGAMWGRRGWNGPTQPVAGVSWHEARAYARWAGRDLPTDAQWEKAARGTDGRRYPWGNTFPTDGQVNFDENVGRTTPVDAYPRGRSPYGCYDMSGNVNNWCRDWYWEGFYRHLERNGPLVDPVLDDDGADVLGIAKERKCDRGGGFATSQSLWEVLSTTRKTPWPPSFRNPWNGFRTVWQPPHTG